MEATRRGKLELTITEGKGLPAKDINGYADPYCKFYWRGNKYKSSVKRKTLNPTWNEKFLLPFDLVEGPFLLHVEIWDYNSFASNKYMATLEVDLSTLKADCPPSLGWYKLQGTGATGQLKMSIRYLAAATEGRRGSTGQQTVLQANNSPPYGRTPLYPSLPSSPPSHLPASRPTAPTVNTSVPPPQAPMTTASNSDVGYTKALKDIKEILPQCSYTQISEALRKCGNNKDSAIDYLLQSMVSLNSSSVTTTATTTTTPFSPYTTYIDSSSLQTGAAHPPVHYGSCAAPPPRFGITHNGRKKALLVGINYSGSRCQLRGCVNDVKRMRQLLCGLYGFVDNPHTMVCLTDDNVDPRYLPTRVNVTMAMRWLAAQTQPGDCLWFHFSGHGAQQRDHTGMEADGMDETILPMDFKHAGHIVDDEINAALVQSLPEGVRLTAVMDCCHSGTGMDLSFVWDTKKCIWEEDDNPLHVACDVQLFSGCRDDQTSADACTPCSGEAGGAMTMAFITTLAASPHSHSYVTLMQEVHRNMKNRGFRQRPQLTATQRFDPNRRFTLTDIVMNQNPLLGRQIRRTKQRRRFSSGGAGNIMLGVGGGLLAGLLLDNLFD